MNNLCYIYQCLTIYSFIGQGKLLDARKGQKPARYLAYGELFLEQRSTANYFTPFKFSAKEKDEETGYGYFGARYLATDISIWGSVDQKADKGPSISPYVYCFNNPIILNDPDGKWPGFIHRMIINIAFKPLVKTKEITNKQIEFIIDGGKISDSRKAGNQTVDKSSIHYMKKPGESNEQAKANTQDYINDKSNDFEKTKDEKQAFTSLGQALHPLMDKTSPTHTDKQQDGSYEPQSNNLPDLTFNPKSWGANLDHLIGEIIPSPDRIKQAVESIRSKFREEIKLRNQQQNINNE